MDPPAASPAPRHGRREALHCGAMKLTINGESRDVDADRVDRLLEVLGMQGQAVAVELNQQVVPKRDHAATELRDGDVLELVTLVGGG
ncbi:MAG: sulfur carrier protein ThiS [Planctomycetota bacterium]